MIVKLNFLLLFAACFLAVYAEGEENSSTKALLPLEDFKKMPVKLLKQLLSSKGLECKGYSEKADYVQQVFDSQDLPDVVPAQPEATPVEKTPDIDKEKMDELMASLKKGGFGNSKMFSAEDLKNMSPEEMTAKFSGDDKTKSSSSKKSKSGKKKSNSSKSKKSSGGNGEKTDATKKAKENVKVAERDVEEEEESHTIEL